MVNLFSLKHHSGKRERVLHGEADSELEHTLFIGAAMDKENAVPALGDISGVLISLYHWSYVHSEWQIDTL